MDSGEFPRGTDIVFSVFMGNITLTTAQIIVRLPTQPVFHGAVFRILVTCLII